jgi:CDP-glycerol glycerophosphotransferase (TagB/SpsB family)
MRILFDIQRLYYLPQYDPVMRALKAHGVECIAIARDADDPGATICRDLLAEDFEIIAATTEDDAIEHARRLEHDWIIVGNDNPYQGRVRGRTALLYHGIGVKRIYYSPHLMNVDLRFVEGPYRKQALAKRFPDARLEAIGFPKLDPLLNGSAIGFNDTISRFPASRPTLLYTPTFFPSSIGYLPADFPAWFEDCNLVIKPHQLSLTHSSYRHQRERFRQWEKFPNVFVADAAYPSLVPFMADADLLISEASSALFEFAALDRPVVWCDFLKLRWSYRGPFRYRLRQRMDDEILRYADVGAHAASPRQLARQVREELDNPERFAAQRCRVTDELIGNTDGHAAERAADILMNT